MTKFQTAELSCPQCNTKQEIEVYQTLNVTIDPEKKKDLFEGRINILTCTRCQHKAPIDTIFLYHDMMRKIAIYYYPPQAIGNPDFLKQFKSDGTLNHEMGFPGKALEESSSYLIRHPHIVFSMNELLTYVVFRDKLFEMLGEQNG